MERDEEDIPKLRNSLFFASLRDLCGLAVNSPIRETTKRTKPHKIKEAD